MTRLSWPCLALFVVLLSGCSILQDMGVASQSGITTPSTGKPAQQQGVMDSAAARKAPSAPRPAPSMSAPQQTAVQTPSPSPSASATKVALLAPLSGKSAGLGQAMVNAAQLAVFDVGVDRFELMPRDTKGTADGAVQAAHDAISSGAQLLIGPLFAADVAAVKPVVRETNVNMLALSTDVSLAESGVYVMGFAPAPQVERVVSYAAQRGAQHFAAVIPSGPYGQLVSKAFERAVRERGGTIIASEPLANISAVIAQKDKIDALFLPFGGAELRKIAAQFSAAGFDRGRLRVLGTGLWDEPNLAQGEPFLLGGWFAAAEPDARERFMSTYQENYGQPAPRLATLAYDSTALAAVLARSGALFDRTALSMPSGFTGLDGVFRLLPSGQIERGLAVLEVSTGNNVIIDASPSSFSSL